MLNLLDTLKHELTELDKIIQKVFVNEQSLITEVCRYVFSSGGKRIRPSMVILGGKIFNGNSESLRKIGASLELIHTATLLHDDVVDNSDIRRGKPTVASKWGRETAILVADYLFSNSFALALETLKPEVLLTLTKVTNKMCEGEIYQLQKRGCFFSTDEYFKLVECKTASLFSACPALGAISANANADEINNLFDFGMNFGIAFQITDDILDYTGDKNKIGKPVGNDLKEGKQTLPFIHTLNSAKKEDKEQIIDIFNNGRDFDSIFKFIKKYNGIEYAQETAKKYSALALDAINKIPENQYSMMLAEYAGSVVKREF